MDNPAVRLINVAKRFGEFVAVERMDLDIADGGFVTFLGPSGCGKTTTLRMIAGLLDPSEGDIHIKGKRVNNTPIHQRNLGVVFQNYALFPHKTIYDNVAFGLQFRKLSRDEAKKQVNEALELVQLPNLADRYPRQLSGGQQQRIALARAMVIQPDVLLLDEPLSALDAKLREDMRIELKRIQQQTGITSVFVTHDQAEALAMSDQIVVMSNGRVEQVGAPDEVYNTPASEFVARFLGISNISDVRVGAVDRDAIKVESAVFGDVVLSRERAPDITEIGPARLVVRAEKLKLSTPGAGAEGTISIPANIETVDYQGHVVRYFIRVNEQKLQAVEMIDVAPYNQGEKVTVHVQPKNFTVLPAS